MDINNIQMINGLYVYKTENYASIKLKFWFLLSQDEDELLVARVLSKYLIRTNKRYKSYKEIMNKLRWFYNMDLSIKTTHVGVQHFFEIEASLLDPRIVEDGYMKDALEFIHEILFNPSFKAHEVLGKNSFLFSMPKTLSINLSQTNSKRSVPK